MDALYFPSLSLPGAAWTNPNLLYFDKIGVIAPSGNERDLFDGPTRMLIEHRLVQPIDPQRYALDDRGDELVIGHLLGIAPRQRDHGPIAKIHLGKISYTSFLQELLRLGMLWRSNASDWLEGPSWVVDYIMSVLATRMIAHPELKMSLVTDQSFASRLITGTSDSRRVVRRLKLLARLLPIGPEATIDDILNFRQENRQELKQFRSLVEGLILRSRGELDGQNEFEARIREAERLRDHLVDRLRAVSSRNYTELALSISNVVAPLIEHSLYSVGAAVGGLAYIILKMAKKSQQKRDIMSERLIYSALAVRRFAPQSSDSLLY